MSEMREPEAVASSGGYYTMLESAPEVDPARRPVSGPVAGYGAFPAPGAPGAPVPGMVSAPMMAPAPAKVRAPSGAEAWGAGLFGLLVLVAVPGVNLVLGPVVMMVAGLRGSRGLLEPERTNRCRAASWGLTFLLGEVLLIGAQLYIVQVVFGAGERVPLFPWGLPALFWLVLLVAHFVVCIAQGIRAYRGGVTRFGGIPFFR